MNTDEHDDLWELLGKAEPPRVSPFFARNILRTIREETPAPGGVFAWLRQQWQVAALGAMAVAAALAVLATSQVPSETPDQLVALAQQVSVSPDYQVIAHLDELLASEESSVWLDTSVQ